MIYILTFLTILILTILIWGIPGIGLFLFIGFGLMRNKFEEFLDGDKPFFADTTPAVTTIICGPVMWFAVFMTRRENWKITMAIRKNLEKTASKPEV